MARILVWTTLDTPNSDTVCFNRESDDVTKWNEHLSMWRYEAFLEEGEALVMRSQRLRTLQTEAEVTAVWEWRHGTRPHLPGNSFLVSRENPRQHKKRRAASNSGSYVDPTESKSIAHDDINALLDDEQFQYEESDDQAIASVTSTDSGADETVLYEFHIVFHAVYQTPVLYFRLVRVDGMPVAFDGQLIRELRLPGGNAQAPLVAMDDHQVLGTPFNLLHPCETASAMALLLDQPTAKPSIGTQASSDSGAASHEDQDTTSQPGLPTYLLAWMSLVQPLTHINPLMY